MNAKLWSLEDDIKKLNNALTLAKRSQPPIKAECLVYPLEGSKKLCVQIPDDVSRRFRNEELAGAGVAVPYDPKRFEELNGEERKLEGLLESYEDKKSAFRQRRDGVRTSAGKKKDELESALSKLKEQRTTLEHLRPVRKQLEGKDREGGAGAEARCRQADIRQDSRHAQRRKRTHKQDAEGDSRTRRPDIRGLPLPVGCLRSIGG